MAQTNADIGCLILDEFVDDAAARGKPTPPANQSAPDPLAQIVQRIAKEAGVPQFNLAEIVQRVIAALGPEIESRIRHELSQSKDGNSAPASKDVVS